MSKDSARGIGWRRARPPAPRTGAALTTALAAAVAVLAACGGSPSPAASGRSPGAGGSAHSPSAVAYSACMRSHGVPDYPDPTSIGGVPTLPKGDAQHFGVSTSRYQAATQACRHLYPAPGGSIQQCELTGVCPQAVVQHALVVMRKYARCLRAHGVPNWPDPTLDSQGRPYFNVSGVGITHQYTHSALFESKDRECERLVGGSAGVPVPLG